VTANGRATHGSFHARYMHNGCKARKGATKIDVLHG
jgi:hypothetical protein